MHEKFTTVNNYSFLPEMIDQTLRRKQSSKCSLWNIYLELLVPRQLRRELENGKLVCSQSNKIAYIAILFGRNKKHCFHKA